MLSEWVKDDNKNPGAPILDDEPIKDDGMGSLTLLYLYLEQLETAEMTRLVLDQSKYSRLASKRILKALSKYKSKCKGILSHFEIFK